ncbi:uncharacterized protein BX663DRAFT_490738 [Cokeromyces recurvatus]|uniref:uncharacterized protein n=1 Tax=Cokeromyces recurvatus TaxID=90255 RepID=UPI00221F4D90|nr:uncharacterized protein BX663DRAFT_490738 [Cokeromyces recurvatus]KAI7897611.1 hypothetical protein BX663DRAFT_490738 [Cokeromyces recurvatus]
MIFAQVAGGSHVLTAHEAKEVLSRSNIGDDNLAQIWDLSNVTGQPQLTFPEFATAMYLTSMKMSGSTIPRALPDSIRNELRNAVSIITNSSSALTLNNPQSTLHSSISTQPTGYNPSPRQLPPQVAMPSGMLNNTLNFTNRMMPQSSYYTPPTSFEALSSSVKIPWAVTDEEKKQYTKIFKAWDTEKRGILTGEKAKEIFSQSGLPQNVLMQIWNLSDPNNQGKLNVDEFAVAMHLIYRKLNGYNLPETLPPELIPPSTRDLNESVSHLKNSILQDIAKKRQLANFRSTPSESPKTAQKKEKEDTDVGYVSSARRMGPDRTRTRDLSLRSSSSSSSSNNNSSSYGYRGKQTRIFDLRKEIEEKRRYIKELEEEAKEPIAKPYTALSSLEKREIDGLKERIRELQIEISKTGGEQSRDAWDEYIAKSTELASLAEQEKTLEDEIEYILDATLKGGLLVRLNETEDDLKERKIKALKQEANTTTNFMPLNIVGIGPNGEVTESDRIKAKAKAMVAARMGKLTGKSINQAEIDKINEEREEFRLYADSIASELNRMEEAVKTIRLEMSMIGLDIRKQDQDQKKIEERAQFEYGDHVAKDLKQFIEELKYDAALAKAPEVDPSFESRFPEF